ncbi:glycine-rich family protein [Striga asiatica]|uniref:Glycine-rich family protein n=1 Tax=Striga asiatica TaxID=4170 RepID=A0A5A7QRT2_STRAF|nr:glycine-rich family protein [Striga asiatica]
MKENLININGFHKTDPESASLWKWKQIDFRTKNSENRMYRVPEFFQETSQKTNDVVLGPGVGAGIGCGVGLGLGVVGAAGLGGTAWNQLTAVFGIGIGCGAGIGVGYGQGFGGGFSLESLRSYLMDPKRKYKKRHVLKASLLSTKRLQSPLETHTIIDNLVLVTIK